MVDPKDTPYGQNKPASTPPAVLKKSLVSNAFFKDNIYYSFLYKKTERLTSALHMVTNFIPATEPVRVRLRDKAIALVEQTLSLKQGNSTKSAASLDTVIASVIEIISLLETAYAAGYISAMNGNLLREEYEKLAEFMRSHRVELGVWSDGLEDYVTTPAMPERSSEVVRRPVAQTENASHKIATRAVHNGRRDAILALLKDKEKITVKDAISAAPGMSEKTVQRELSALVLEGVLIKKGERRWSTYELAKQGI